MLTNPFMLFLVLIGLMLFCISYHSFVKKDFRVIGTIIGAFGLLFVAAGGGLGIPVAFNNQQLSWLSTNQTLPVWRLGATTLGDAPPLLFKASNSTCITNSGNGDGGSEVKPDSGSGCFLAVFPSDGADVRQFGAKCDWDGTTGTNDATALTAALAYAATNGDKVLIPPKACSIGSQVTATFSADKLSLSLQGRGIDSSQLVWTNAAPGGMVINYAGQFNSVKVSDLTIATNVVNGGTGLNLNQTGGTPTSAAAPSTLTHVVFRGTDGYIGGTKYWTIGNQTNGVSNVTWDGVKATGINATVGTGIDLEGTVALNGAIYNIKSSNFICLGTGIKYGSYIQGVTVSGGSNFVCGTNGILVPAGGVSLDQLTVIGNQFQTTYGIRDLAGVPSTHVIGNLFITDAVNAFGVSMEVNTTRTIIGNECQSGSVTSTCIQILAGGGMIDGNNIVNQHLGINLGVSSASVIVGHNFFPGTTTEITNAGSNNLIDGDFAWTPTVLGETTAGTPTYGIRNGFYHRSYKHIWASFYITISALGSMAGNLDISGFPAANTSAMRGNCALSMYTGITGNPKIAGFIEASANPPVAKLIEPSTGGAANAYTAPMTFVGECSYTLP